MSDFQTYRSQLNEYSQFLASLISDEEGKEQQIESAMDSATGQIVGGSGIAGASLPFIKDPIKKIYAKLKKTDPRAGLTEEELANPENINRVSRGLLDALSDHVNQALRKLGLTRENLGTLASRFRDYHAKMPTMNQLKSAINENTSITNEELLEKFGLPSTKKINAMLEDARATREDISPVLSAEEIENEINNAIKNNLMANNIPLQRLRLFKNKVLNALLKGDTQDLSGGAQQLYSQIATRVDKVRGDIVSRNKIRNVIKEAEDRGIDLDDNDIYNITEANNNINLDNFLTKEPNLLRPRLDDNGNLTVHGEEYRKFISEARKNPTLELEPTEEQATDLTSRIYNKIVRNRGQVNEDELGDLIEKTPFSEQFKNSLNALVDKGKGVFNRIGEIFKGKNLTDEEAERLLPADFRETRAPMQAFSIDDDEIPMQDLGDIVTSVKPTDLAKLRIGDIPDKPLPKSIREAAQKYGLKGSGITKKKYTDYIDSIENGDILNVPLDAYSKEALDNHLIDRYNDSPFLKSKFTTEDNLRTALLGDSKQKINASSFDETKKLVEDMRQNDFGIDPDTLQPSDITALGQKTIRRLIPSEQELADMGDSDIRKIASNLMFFKGRISKDNLTKYLNATREGRLADIPEDAYTKDGLEKYINSRYGTAQSLRDEFPTKQALINKVRTSTKDELLDRVKALQDEPISELKTVLPQTGVQQRIGTMQDLQTGTEDIPLQPITGVREVPSQTLTVQPEDLAGTTSEQQLLKLDQPGLLFDDDDAEIAQDFSSAIAEMRQPSNIKMNITRITNPDETVNYNDLQTELAGRFIDLINQDQQISPQERLDSIEEFFSQLNSGEIDPKELLGSDERISTDNSGITNIDPIIPEASASDAERLSSAISKAQDMADKELFERVRLESKRFGKRPKAEVQAEREREQLSRQQEHEQIMQRDQQAQEDRLEAQKIASEKEEAEKTAKEAAIEEQEEKTGLTPEQEARAKEHKDKVDEGEGDDVADVADPAAPAAEAAGLSFGDILPVIGISSGIAFAIYGGVEKAKEEREREREKRKAKIQREDTAMPTYSPVGPSRPFSTTLV